MLHGLGSSEKARVEGGHSLEVLDDLGALLRDTVNGGAG
jgi:hypothetical protein